MVCLKRSISIDPIMYGERGKHCSTPEYNRTHRKFRKARLERRVTCDGVQTVPSVMTGVCLDTYDCDPFESQRSDTRNDEECLNCELCICVGETLQTVTDHNDLFVQNHVTQMAKLGHQLKTMANNFDLDPPTLGRPPQELGIKMRLIADQLDAKYRSS